MNKNLTEIVFLLDRSGSMSGLEKDTIGGFNSFIERQCQEEGEVKLTTVLFDDNVEVLWDGVDAKRVSLTRNEYFVRGCTALLDAIGKTILDVGIRLSNTPEGERPRNIIFVITTDGMENSSQEFTYEKINSLIHHQAEKYNWQFLFMGANIDVAKEAENLGIKQEQAFQFEATDVGVEKMYESVCEMVLEKRNTMNE
ncbi:von Willebrand factor type A domain protein [Bacillus sp. THAF10]|uniref:vWA domain-containing protein n=1 Tax=Bacillus sp. THAF10 TaxID=2587848 RepID=UPI001268D141|nr:vWA domain-containing protein [Bacillus sp. THAF10]QFT88023.1 von Willebrand factor type A domain protein [Bacillus sp. THAF10]